ncbi:hypothetical protein BSKO_00322 [Bryopsis sp. KO-2023]|nr:hypothetical protein BSKO_00322 [Bryopsis sp. KO-2023]
MLPAKPLGWCCWSFCPLFWGCASRRGFPYHLDLLFADFAGGGFRCKIFGKSMLRKQQLALMIGLAGFLVQASSTDASLIWGAMSMLVWTIAQGGRFLLLLVERDTSTASELVKRVESILIRVFRKWRGISGRNGKLHEGQSINDPKRWPAITVVGSK